MTTAPNSKVSRRREEVSNHKTKSKEGAGLAEVAGSSSKKVKEKGNE
jgi:hypothetical protein